MDLPWRIGFGSDIHRLKSDFPLIIGGINIKYKYGLAAHSDGDVLIHAIIDAILGALGENDIGYYFPDTDPKYKNADSQNLLKQTLPILQNRNYRMANIDSVIYAQKPKLQPYIPGMKDNLSEILGIPSQNISIKAKTGENLGFIGREEGIKAEAIILLYQ